MAERQPVIVIKKINVQAAGAHGGSWKVAFADFMTALMAFFLLMWLVGQSDATKKNISDYFSTPSIIEYNYSTYGVELTLEKLFLDLINEPLKFFQAFVTPTDYTPNIMAMGSKRIVLHHLADQLGDLANNVEVNGDQVSFDIPANKLFVKGTPDPSPLFVSIMDKVTQITSGLEDSNVFLDSNIYDQAVPKNDVEMARNVSEARLDLLTLKIQSTLEHQTVDIYGKSQVKVASKEKLNANKNPDGSIRIKIKQKDFTLNGRKPRKLDQVFGKKEDDGDSVYNSFVKNLTKGTSPDKNEKH